MKTEQIVYLLRKTSLTLEAIGKMSPYQFSILLREVHYQESVENYYRQLDVATILAAIYNTIPRKSSRVFEG